MCVTTCQVAESHERTLQREWWATQGNMTAVWDSSVMLSCTGSMWQIRSRSSSVWRCISVFTVMPRTTCPNCAQVAERQHLCSANRRLLVVPRIQLDTYSSVVRSPLLVRPSGTHLAMICAIQISASPALVAYLRHIWFSSIWRIERIRGIVW